MRETAVPAIVLGAVTDEDAVAVNRVAAAVAMLDHPPVCFAGGPATIDTTVASGAVQLPRSLDAAVAVVADVTASRSGLKTPLTGARGTSMLHVSRPAPALRQQFRAHHLPGPPITRR